MPNCRLDRPTAYRIKVLGHLDQSWSAWLNGMTKTYDVEGNDIPTTTLTGPVADQSSLRGLLSKIWDLNLILISLTRTCRDSDRVTQNED